MRHLPLTLLCLLLLFSEATVGPCHAGEDDPKLPFDPSKICRLSLDGKPRSISIRQGDAVWIGYDLEKATVFKVWQAPQDKPGVILKGFKASSSGTPLFEAKDAGDWRLTAGGKSKPLAVRYLGCTRADAHFQLSWEFVHPGGKVILAERIPMTPGKGNGRVYREVRVESLKADESLSLPLGDGSPWVLTNAAGKSVTTLSGPDWHRISLR